MITGKLSKNRDFFENIIESHNGNISNSITSKTTFLLAGEKAGSKLDKANNLGVKTLNEDQFYKNIERRLQYEK